MDQETANKLFDIGGFLLFLDAPPNLEFGIDYNAWTIGPLFKGVKLIPPGLHFIYFSATSKEGVQGIRTGFFHFFESKEVLVREWNSEIEDLRDSTEIDPLQIERLASSKKWSLDPRSQVYINTGINKCLVKKDIRDFDRNMGPYPLDPPIYYQRWKILTSYITSGLIRRILPNNGKVSHLPEKSAEGKEVEKEENMDFTPFDLRKSFPAGATGMDVTRWSLDKSWLTKDLLSRVYHDDYKVMLGELQLSFVCLLMAQNFSGFQQWKKLVQLLCSCNELVHEKPKLFLDFMDVLQSQLEECPDDFFRDILLENNFTSVMLKTLGQNIKENSETLVIRFEKLKKFIMNKFNWDIPQQNEEDKEEDDEDAPVIVEL